MKKNTLTIFDKIITIALMSILSLVVLIMIFATYVAIGVSIEMNSEDKAESGDTSESTLGSTLPIAGSTYTLAGSGITSSGASITLQSFTIPQNGYKIQDSDLSDTFYITLEPGSTKRQEIASCTTATQNANDTATLSGCTRGLSPITPFTASSSLRFAHAGGTQVIFSDPPQLFNQYVSLANAETISGLKTFSIFPEFSDGTTPTTTNQFATKGYADNLVNQGAATSSPTVAGIAELATRIENASSTAWGVNDPHVQQSQHATSTPSANAFTDGTVWDIWSENDGKLNQLWLDLTEAFTWTGTHSFSGDSSFATTTINKQAEMRFAEAEANGTNYTALKATTSITSNLTWTLPATDGSAYQSILTNGNGNLYWGLPIPNYTVGSSTIASTTLSETNGGVTSYTKVKEIVVIGYGQVDVIFSLKTVNASYAALGRIYVNDIAVGTPRTTSGTTLTQYSEYITVEPQDKISLYIYDAHDGGQAYASSLIIKANTYDSNWIINK